MESFEDESSDRKSSRSGKMGLSVLSSQLGITRSRANDVRQLAKCTKHFVTDNMQDAPIEMSCLADKKVNQTINLMIKQDQKDKLEKEIPLVSFF